MHLLLSQRNLMTNEGFLHAFFVKKNFRKWQIQACGGKKSFNKRLEEWKIKDWNVGFGEPYRQEYAEYYYLVWNDGIDEAYKQLLNDGTIADKISKDEFIKQTSNWYTFAFEWNNLI